jgi:glycosyltransferase involved in cell wall biosynthesis
MFPVLVGSSPPVLLEEQGTPHTVSVPQPRNASAQRSGRDVTLQRRPEDSVGVVIPAYNAERFLATAIESALAQTHPPTQTVVVDDGSSDGTGAIARRFAPRVSCIRQSNAGVASARNRGAETLGTRWLAFLDADDFWRADKLERQLAAARQADAAVVFCHVELVDAEGLVIPSSRTVDTSLDIEPLILHSATIPQATSSTALLRRDVFEAVGGYDSQLATMADWDLLIRLRLRGPFAYVEAPLASYRRHGKTMSRNLSMLERESKLVLNKTFANPALSPSLRRLRSRALAWNNLVLCGSHWRFGDRKKSLRFGLRAIAGDPRLAWYVLGLPLRRRP